MPLDSAFDTDDAQPWWQMGPPLRITVHPATPPGPPADNSAASQDLESDGYPNDWIVPAREGSASQGNDNEIVPANAATSGSVPYGSIDSDGYPNDWIEPDGCPSDWIVPASASPARNINNKIAPAKGAAIGSVPYGSIESDGYPNDWIEQDGYPADWIVPAQRPVLNGPYRASSTGFLANGPRLSSVASPPWSPQNRAQTGSGDSAASRPAYWPGPSAFQQQSPSRLVVPVSNQATTRPAWIPLGPGSGWEPWADQFIKACRVSSTIFARVKVLETPMRRGARRSGTMHDKNAHNGSHNQIRQEVSLEDIETLRTARGVM